MQEASEANYRERFQALVERKEQLQRELDQGQTFILKVNVHTYTCSVRPHTLGAFLLKVNVLII